MWLFLIEIKAVNCMRVFPFWQVAFPVFVNIGLVGFAGFVGSFRFHLVVSPRRCHLLGCESLNLSFRGFESMERRVDRE